MVVGQKLIAKNKFILWVEYTGFGSQIQNNRKKNYFLGFLVAKTKILLNINSFFFAKYSYLAGMQTHLRTVASDRRRCLRLCLLVLVNCLVLPGLWHSFWLAEIDRALLCSSALYFLSSHINNATISA